MTQPVYTAFEDGLIARLTGWRDREVSVRVGLFLWHSPYPGCVLGHRSGHSAGYVTTLKGRPRRAPSSNASSTSSISTSSSPAVKRKSAHNAQNPNSPYRPDSTPLNSDSLSSVPRRKSHPPSAATAVHHLQRGPNSAYSHHDPKSDSRFLSTPAPHPTNGYSSYRGQSNHWPHSNGQSSHNTNSWSRGPASASPTPAPSWPGVDPHNHRAPARSNTGGDPSSVNHSTDFNHEYDGPLDPLDGYSDAEFDEGVEYLDDEDADGDGLGNGEHYDTEHTEGSLECDRPCIQSVAEEEGMGPEEGHSAMEARERRPSAGQQQHQSGRVIGMGTAATNTLVAPGSRSNTGMNHNQHPLPQAVSSLTRVASSNKPRRGSDVAKDRDRHHLGIGAPSSSMMEAAATSLSGQAQGCSSSPTDAPISSSLNSQQQQQTSVSSTTSTTAATAVPPQPSTASSPTQISLSLADSPFEPAFSPSMLSVSPGFFTSISPPPSGSSPAPDLNALYSSFGGNGPVSGSGVSGESGSAGFAQSPVDVGLPREAAEFELEFTVGLDSLPSVGGGGASGSYGIMADSPPPTGVMGMGMATGMAMNMSLGSGMAQSQGQGVQQQQQHTHLHRMSSLGHGGHNQHGRPYPSPQMLGHGHHHPMQHQQITQQQHHHQQVTADQARRAAQVSQASGMIGAGRGMRGVNMGDISPEVGATGQHQQQQMTGQDFMQFEYENGQFETGQIQQGGGVMTIREQEDEDDNQVRWMGQQQPQMAHAQAHSRSNTGVSNPNGRMEVVGKTRTRADSASMMRRMDSTTGVEPGTPGGPGGNGVGHRANALARQMSRSSSSSTVPLSASGPISGVPPVSGTALGVGGGSLTSGTRGAAAAAGGFLTPRGANEAYAAMARARFGAVAGPGPAIPKAPGLFDDLLPLPNTASTNRYVLVYFKFVDTMSFSMVRTPQSLLASPLLMYSVLALASAWDGHIGESRSFFLRAKRLLPSAMAVKARGLPLVQSLVLMAKYVGPVCGKWSGALDLTKACVQIAKELQINVEFPGLEDEATQDVKRRTFWTEEYEITEAMTSTIANGTPNDPDEALAADVAAMASAVAGERRNSAMVDTTVSHATIIPYYIRHYSIFGGAVQRLHGLLTSLNPDMSWADPRVEEIRKIMRLVELEMEGWWGTLPANVRSLVKKNDEERNWVFGEGPPASWTNTSGNKLSFEAGYLFLRHIHIRFVWRGPWIYERDVEYWLNSDALPNLLADSERYISILEGLLRYDPGLHYAPEFYGLGLCRVTHLWFLGTWHMLSLASQVHLSQHVSPADSPEVVNGMGMSAVGNFQQQQHHQQQSQLGIQGAHGSWDKLARYPPRTPNSGGQGSPSSPGSPKQAMHYSMYDGQATGGSPGTGGSTNSPGTTGSILQGIQMPSVGITTGMPSATLQGMQTGGAAMPSMGARNRSGSMSSSRIGIGHAVPETPYMATGEDAELAEQFLEYRRKGLIYLAALQTLSKRWVSFEVAYNMVSEWLEDASKIPKSESLVNVVLNECLSHGELGFPGLEDGLLPMGGIANMFPSPELQWVAANGR
ncbi:hypothetical protein HDU93_007741 [Gonapodya sp. JEL0774]|nr:hypothetical protein HDU93_007741 [Gonapodya sp. JEL0774]